MIDEIRRTTGHTLPELLVMLGIAAIVATAAVPVFSRLVLESRMNAAITTAAHAVNLGRQISATRGETIRLCGGTNAPDCSGAADWSHGFLLADDAGAYQQSLPLPAGAQGPRIRSNRAVLSFEGGSGFATPATLTICDRRGARAARALIVSRSGRPRTSDRDGSDRPLAC